MKAIVPLLFIVMCIAQWYVPGSMVVAQEDLLANGKVFHFRTAPVDPYDPFRGKYIILDFEDEVFDQGVNESLKTGDRAFALLEKDSTGHATIKALSQNKPALDEDFIEIQVGYVSDNRVRVEFPFSRFYLEESKAELAEDVYLKNSRDTTQKVYAVVRVKAGKSALEDVKINDRSITDIVRDINSTLE